MAELKIEISNAEKIAFETICKNNNLDVNEAISKFITHCIDNEKIEFVINKDSKTTKNSEEKKTKKYEEEEVENNKKEKNKTKSTSKKSNTKVFTKKNTQTMIDSIGKLAKGKNFTEVLGDMTSDGLFTDLAKKGLNDLFK